MQILAWILAGVVTLTGSLSLSPTPSSPLGSMGQSIHKSPLAALPGLQQVFSGTPEPLGVKGEALFPCPDSPNCVVSQAADPEHAIAPMAYQTDQKTAYATLLDILSVVPRTTVVERQGNYIRAESSSRLMGFVDDVEFYFPADQKVIHMRSASRLGESDLGVNRRRLEQIRLAAQDLGL